jgi:hypothetical protein
VLVFALQDVAEHRAGGGAANFLTGLGSLHRRTILPVQLR